MAGKGIEMKALHTVALALSLAIMLSACGQTQQKKSFIDTVNEIERLVLSLDSDISIAHDAYFVALGNAPTNNTREYVSYCTKTVIPLIAEAESKSKNAAYKIDNILSETQKNSSYSDDQRKWLNTFLGLMKKVYTFRAEYYATTVIANQKIGDGENIVKTLLEDAEGKRGASDANRLLASALIASLKDQVGQAAQK